MGSNVELLAPAGTWEALEAVVGAGADAVYLGGKRFNMRMHRKDFNFDEDQLRAAVEYAHAHGVRLFVTVNNLLSDEEAEEVVEYLQFLDSIGVDAVIIQDLVILDILQTMDYRFEVHASVMMNTSNIDTVRYLKDRGVTRIVTSREMSLEQIYVYTQEVEMEFEYFIHGDMCYSQSGQCLYGGVLFGLSSNRGKCVKPCRWPLRFQGEEEFQHSLAVKDMCMFEMLPPLIYSGVSCFKIEGRMRSPEFLAMLVSAYRHEIDHILADPGGYQIDAEVADILYDNRVREFSTCFAFGNPGRESIDPTGVREPRQFSKAVQEPEITEEVTAELRSRLMEGINPATRQGCKNSCQPSGDVEGVDKSDAVVSVSAPTFAHFTAAVEAGAERIIVGGDAYRPLEPWTLDELLMAFKLGERYNREVILRTPSIMMEKEMKEFKELLPHFVEHHLRVMTGNIGVIEALYAADAEFTLYGDVGLNAYNSRTFAYLKRQGFASAMISLEAGVNEVKSIARKSPVEVEVLALGPIRGMVSDICLKGDGNSCKHNCQGGWILEDEAGCTHRVEADQYCRNHIYLQNHLSVLPLMGELAANGVRVFRIESLFYTPDELKELIRIFQRVIRFEYDPAIIEDAYVRLQQICQAPLMYGALVSNQ